MVTIIEQIVNCLSSIMTKNPVTYFETFCAYACAVLQYIICKGICQISSLDGFEGLWSWMKTQLNLKAIAPLLIWPSEFFKNLQE